MENVFMNYCFDVILYHTLHAPIHQIHVHVLGIKMKIFPGKKINENQKKKKISPKSWKK